MKKILTSFKSRKKQKMILEDIIIDRANRGKLFHPNKIFIPFYISKDVILDVVAKKNFEIYDYQEYNHNGILGFLNIKSHEISIKDLSAQEGK